MSGSTDAQTAGCSLISNKNTIRDVHTLDDRGHCSYFEEHGAPSLQVCNISVYESRVVTSGIGDLVGGRSLSLS